MRCFIEVFLDKAGIVNVGCKLSGNAAPGRYTAPNNSGTQRDIARYFYFLL
jgi:hypothetical protein